MGLLLRFRLQRQVGHLVEAAGEGDWLRAEQALDPRDRLFEAPDANRGRVEADSQRRIVGTQPATADTQFQTSLRKEVERGRSLGQQDWMVESFANTWLPRRRVVVASAAAISPTVGVTPPQLGCSPMIKVE